MKLKSVLASIFIYTLLISAFIFTFHDMFKFIMPQKSVASAPERNFSQPELKDADPWSIKSIDTQVITKHWQNVSEESIKEQVKLLKDLNVNYIAIATPYNRPEDMRLWVNEIHSQGLNVWFRSHWDEWEGDNGQPQNMTPQQYLDYTRDFIINNPDLFREGDSFTMCVEPENVGVGIGKKIRDWREYREFMLSQIADGNDAFKKIGLERKVHTNWASVNGWVVLNAFTPELVDKMQLITVDHFSSQSTTIGKLDDPDQIANQMSQDLNEMFAKWHKPILLGEWGYQINQETTEPFQAEVVKKTLEKLKPKEYLAGVNYWSHMGHHSRIIGDEKGANLKYRKAAFVLKDIFTPPAPAEKSEEEPLVSPVSD